MTEVEYDDFLKHKLAPIDYDARWLEVKKLDKRVKLTDDYSCTYAYTYRFTLVENIRESVIEAVKTAIALKRVFNNDNPVIAKVETVRSDYRYIEITPRLAKIEYYVNNDYYTEELNNTKVKKEDVALGKAMLKWDKTSGSFLLPNGEQIELPDKIGNLTYKQLYNSTITKWVNEIYAMLYSK